MKQVLALVLLAVAATGSAHAQDFFAGKQITLLIGTTAGGGYDAYGRLLARHIGRHIPGNPAIVAKNMPGAGGAALANHLYNRAPKIGKIARPRRFRPVRATRRWLSIPPSRHVIPPTSSGAATISSDRS